MTTHIITAMDADRVALYPPMPHTRPGVVTVLNGSSCPLDRDAVVALINGLTDHLATFDAAEKAKADAKLKRGDKVYRNGNPQSRFIITSDETEDGYINAVRLADGGSFRPGQPAHWFTRVETYRAPAPF